MNIKELTERFESEVWLFISGELDEFRVKFWTELIEIHPELKEILRDAENVESLNLNDEVPDLSDEKYDSIMKEATAHKQYGKIAGFIRGKSFNDSVKNSKIIIGALLAAAAAALIFILPDSSRNNDFRQPLYSWDSQFINKQFEFVGSRVEELQTENFEERMLDDFSLNGWDAKVNRMYNKIKSIEKKMDYKSL